MNFFKFLRQFSVGVLAASLIAACSSAATTSTLNPDAIVAQSQPTTTPAVEVPAPIWNVGWQACGVLSPFDVSVSGCLPDMRIERDRSRGDTRGEPPILMWADDITAPEDIHIETENNFTGGVRAHLFVRSKGCVVTQPGAEDFYYTGISAQISTRMAREGAPVPQAQWTVTPQQLNPQEATEVVAQLQSRQAGRGQLPRYQLSGSRGVCLPLEQWRSR